MERIGVAYLWRKGNEPVLAKRFFESMAIHPAGMAFDFYIILKGFNELESETVLSEYINSLPFCCTKILVSDEFFGVNAIIDCAELIGNELYFPMVSGSRIQADGWLKHLCAAYDSAPNCGAVGVSGAHEQLKETPEFPNINLRATAFLINREAFVTFERGSLDTKYGNNLFEAGPNSMSKQLQNRNCVLYVVDRLGKTWLPADWQKSLTFRAGNQENLLIADNRTDEYQNGSYRRRLKLARVAWHNTDFVTRPLRIQSFLWEMRRLKQRMKKKFQCT